MQSDSSAVLRALSELGPQRLAEIGRRAGSELDTKIRPSKMSEALLHAIGQPEDFGHLGLSDGEVESIGVAVGLGERASWQPNISAEEFERLPFYNKPSYDQDVWTAVSTAIAHVTAGGAANQETAKPAKKTAAKKPATKKPAMKTSAKKAAAKKAGAKKPAKKTAAKKTGAKTAKRKVAGRKSR
jgi:hypothetical protein